MGSLKDLIQEVPLSIVMKERLEFWEDKHEHVVEENKRLQERIAGLEKDVAALKGENAQLREKLEVPQEPQQTRDVTLGEETTRVLIALFKCIGRNGMHCQLIAAALGMDPGVAQYHLDRLHEANMASGHGNYVDHRVYWSIRSEGRRYVVENKLI